MGIPVLIMGESGSGKSTSLRNFDPAEVGIFNVASKPLPFRKKLQTADGANYDAIFQTLQQPTFKRYAIDDSQYLIAFEFLDKAKEHGYEKFTDMALKFANLIRFVLVLIIPSRPRFFKNSIGLLLIYETVPDR